MNDALLGMKQQFATFGCRLRSVWRMPYMPVQEMKFEKVSQQFDFQDPTTTFHPLRYPNVTNFAIKSAPGIPLTVFADSKVE
jgi:hypothetical protein